MCDTLPFRRIIDLNPDRAHSHPFPALEHKQFQFSFVTVSKQVKSAYAVQLIEAET